MEKNNKICPVTLLQGTQALLIEREIETIRNQLSPDPQELTSINFHMDTDPLENVIETAKTISMFGEKKLLVLKNCESLKAKDLKTLNSYIEKPSPDTFMILVSSQANKPKISKSKNFQSKSFTKINMLEGKIAKEADSLGINLTKKAASELHRLIGDDFTVISNELIKISNYFGTDTRISENEIEKFILKRSDEDIFNLVNSISNKDRKTALRVLKDLENQKYDPLSIVSTLSWRMRQIWQVKELLKMGKSDSDIVSRLKISSGAVYYIKKQAENFSMKSLTETMMKLKNLDTELKSLSQDKYSLITRFVINI